jgi:hypothetical protein
MKTATLFILVFGVVLSLVLTWSFSRPDRPPRHTMIDQAYFICYRCQSAQGGIYGKGPFKEFRSKSASQCVHEWSPVSRDEFKRFTGAVYHQDWSSEIPFWSQ